MNFSEVFFWSAYLFFLYFAVFWFLVFLTRGLKPNKAKRYDEWPIVTIAIPAWNEEECMEETLNSLHVIDYPRDKLQIIVVNDGSTDRTQEITEDFIENKKEDLNIILYNKENGGKASALNFALDKSAGEFFVTFDVDSSIKEEDSNILKHLLTQFEEDNVAAVCPAMKVRDPENFFQKVQFIEFIINAYYKKLMSWMDGVLVCPGPFSVFRTSVCKELGGWDTKNITEDMEFTFRMQKKRYRIIQSIETSIYTRMPGKLRAMENQRNRWYKGTLITLFKHKDMLFKSKYGHFGINVLPTVLVAVPVLMGVLGTATYDYLKPIFNFFKDIFLIKFDIFTLLRNFEIDLNLLNINYMTVATTLFMVSLTIFILYQAFKHTNEKLREYGVISLFFFVGVYFVLQGYFWLRVLVELALGRVQRW